MGGNDRRRTKARRASASEPGSSPITPADAHVPSAVEEHITRRDLSDAARFRLFAVANHASMAEYDGTALLLREYSGHHGS